jgi:hypothetical protein
MISANANIFTGVIFGATLAQDDIARVNLFTTILFDAEAPAGCVASVAGTTA